MQVDLFKSAVNAFSDKALELLKAGATKVGDALKAVPASANSLFASLCSVSPPATHPHVVQSQF